MVSPDGSLIAMHLCDGLLKLLPVTDGFKTQAFNVRVEEFNVVDCTLLAHNKSTLVVVLAQDSHGNRHVTTYTVDVAGCRLNPGPWKADNVGSAASVLIPVRGGAQECVLVLGEGNRITYVGSQGVHHKQGFSAIVPSAWCEFKTSPQAWLVGDMEGGLHTLTVDPSTASSAAGGSDSDTILDKLTMKRTGEASIATALAHLGEGLVFVGSCFGDSQSIQLAEGADAEEHEVVASYSSLSPIVDMAVMDLDRQGQCQLVTASGAYKDGSLRIVRSGIGIDEHAVVPLPGIKGMWALQKETGAEFDTYLVQSFNAETSVLAIQDEELSEVDIAGFQSGVATLHCNTLQGNVLVQVTREKAAFVDASGGAGELAAWSAPAGSSITLADSNGSVLLLSLDAGKLVLLTISGGAGSPVTVTETATCSMPYEVSALALNRPAAPTSDDGDVTLGQTTPVASTLAAVSLWTDISVRLLAVPSLQQLAQEQLTGSIQARSVKIAQMEDREVLFAGMGDGALVSFELGPSADGGAVGLLQKKHMSIGTQPVVLNTFSSAEGTHVFAACDRPTVVYSSHGKLNFNNVNVNEVTLMCPYSSEDFPDCLALANEEELTIGTVDDIQKLHVRSVLLGESPRRVVALPHAAAVAVGTLGEPLEVDEGVEKSFVHLYDDGTFERVTTYQLKDYEQVQSMAAVQLGPSEESTKPYLVVGTAFVVDGEEEPRKGRLLVLSVTGNDDTRAFLLEASKVVEGGAMALAQVRNKLVASINSMVCVFEATEHVATAAPGVGSSAAAASSASDDDGDVQPASSVAAAGGEQDTTSLVLKQECTFHGSVFVLALSVMGDFILVGDLMKSAALLLYLADEKTLQETARDPSCQWLTAQAMQDDQVFMVAESNYNLLSLRRNAGSSSAFEASRLDVAGEFHLGHQVNRIAKGSLVMRPNEVDGGAAGDASSSSAAVGAGAATESADPPTGKRRRAADGAMLSNTAPMQSISSVARPQFIYGTVEGSIGVVLSLSKQLFTYLLRVQLAMATVVSGVGKLDHGTWRSYYSDGHAIPVPLTQNNFGFVDGDFLELFLQLPVDTQLEVVAAVNELPVPEHIPEGDGSKHPHGNDAGPATHKELLLTLEELSRLH